MDLDRAILYFVWAGSLLAAVVFIPRDKARLAWVAFLFKQAITWPLGLYVADRGWIEYPVRFFAAANGTSFTFEYFFYPMVCAFFNVYFPETGGVRARAAYYILYSTALALGELWLLHNTDLIRYFGWNFYWTWVTLAATFYADRRFCVWFFREGRAK